MLTYFKKAVTNGYAAVVWLGGSLTEGEGASFGCFSWQALLAEWMRKTYRECRFLFVNRGIGGTNSEFGLYRLKDEVLSVKPSLLFVEFAVNDYGRDESEIKRDVAAIIENTKSAWGNTDIILVLNTTVKMAEENYDRGSIPPSVRAHEETALKYGVPVIRVGEKFLRQVEEQKLTRTDLLPDSVHPNDRGYKMYFEIVRDAFQKLMREEKTEIEPQQSSAKMSEERAKDICRNPRMIPALVQEAKGFKLLSMEGFSREEISLAGRYKGYISGSRPGSRVELTFYGRHFGLVWMIAPDSGKIRYQVDDGEEKTISSWDTYAKNRERINHKMLAQDLEEDYHKVVIVVEGDKDAESLGTFIRIARWLVG